MVIQKWKWQKKDEDNWVYLPSATDAFPFQISVVNRPYATESLRRTADHQARFGRERLKHFALGPWRPSAPKAREDARRFFYGHTSYDRLLQLYGELMAHYKGDKETFIVPMRRMDERLAFREVTEVHELRQPRRLDEKLLAK